MPQWDICCICVSYLSYMNQIFIYKEGANIFKWRTSLVSRYHWLLFLTCHMCWLYLSHVLLRPADISGYYFWRVTCADYTCYMYFFCQQISVVIISDVSHVLDYVTCTSLVSRYQWLLFLTCHMCPIIHVTCTSSVSKNLWLLFLTLVTCAGLYID